VKTGHTLSGRSTYGFFLTITVCILWGIFPIAAKAVLLETDPHTFNFYRFSLPVVILWGFLAQRRQLPTLLRGQQRPILKRVLVASALLIANYILFAFALGRITPSAAQVLIQTGTMLLLLSGIFIFGERFSKRQWLGCLIFMVGLITFFYYRILDTFDGIGSYGIGMILMIMAAITWASYAILQKPLLNDISPAQILLVVFALGVLVFLPLASPSDILTMSTPAMLGLSFCTISTLIGTSFFAEALAHWEASKISATLTTIPLFTIFFMWGLSFSPAFNITPEPITVLTISGALLVVFGASLVALEKQ
jgi:drug/metabolite transporter (DMT)-like permease